MTLLSFFSDALPPLVRDVLEHPGCLDALQPDSILHPALADSVQSADLADLTAKRAVRNHSMLALFQGGLLYALDSLDAAHAIFQEDSSPYGSYWHGMMHRREGDFSNACYWFARAGRLHEAGEIQQLLQNPPLASPCSWSPEDFTRRCERMARGRPDTPLESLQRIQKIEFSVLLRRCWNAAITVSSPS